MARYSLCVQKAMAMDIVSNYWNATILVLHESAWLCFSRIDRLRSNQLVSELDNEW